MLSRRLLQARVVGLLLAVLVAVFPLTACSDDSRLTVHTAKGEFTFNVEVVDTPEKRAEGLMFRQSLAADAGMLFDFQEVREVSFWMRNTFIPLDMVFISPDGRVEKVHVNARPHDTTSIPSGAPVQFVLEIAGGRSVDIGLAAGDRVEHPRMRQP